VSVWSWLRLTATLWLLRLIGLSPVPCAGERGKAAVIVVAD
jgi:hypothetical protein